jgi:predicted transcriptional regulator
MKLPGNKPKLTREQANYIRDIQRQRNALPSNQQLAEQFGCTRCLVAKIARGLEHKNHAIEAAP